MYSSCGHLGDSVPPRYEPLTEPIRDDEDSEVPTSYVLPDEDSEVAPPYVLPDSNLWSINLDHDYIASSDRMEESSDRMEVDVYNIKDNNIV